MRMEMKTSQDLQDNSAPHTIGAWERLAGNVMPCAPTHTSSVGGMTDLAGQGGHPTHVG